MRLASILRAAHSRRSLHVAARTNRLPIRFFEGISAGHHE